MNIASLSRDLSTQSVTTLSTVEFGIRGNSQANFSATAPRVRSITIVSTCDSELCIDRSNPCPQRRRAIPDKAFLPLSRRPTVPQGKCSQT